MLVERELMAKNPHGQNSNASTPVVTIDGPSASGKSSVSRELARRFGWKWVSTGIFYRGLAWGANEAGIDLTNEDALVEFAASTRWRVELQPQMTAFFFDGVDCTTEINKEAVGSMASKISSLPRVRLALLEAQRDCARMGLGLIAEGRDCGSVVFPNADVKFFLTARAEDRAQRRALEEGRSLEDTISEQKARDRQDASRKAAPMVTPDGSYTIDASQLGFEEVVAEIEQIVRTKLNLQIHA